MVARKLPDDTEIFKQAAIEVYDEGAILDRCAADILKGLLDLSKGQARIMQIRARRKTRENRNKNRRSLPHLFKFHLSDEFKDAIGAGGLSNFQNFIAKRTSKNLYLVYKYGEIPCKDSLRQSTKEFIRGLKSGAFVMGWTKQRGV